MIVIIIGLIVVAIPVTLAWRSAWRLLHGLSAIDAGAVARAIHGRGKIEQPQLTALAEELRLVAPLSLSTALVEVVRATQGVENPLARELALSEAISDAERALVADARTPRVAASLASSAGLLTAALVMRDGLGGTVLPGQDPVPVFMSVIDRGLSLATLAVLGGVVCAALHRCAQAQRARRLAELDDLAEELSRLVAPAEIAQIP